MKKNLVIHTEFKQLEEAWFAFKLGKFSASDAQAIATNGVGLTTLVYEKAAEVLTGKFKESYTNEDIERGILLEESARSAYELETANAVQKVGAIEMSEFVMCSPDGLVGDDGLMEIKNPNAANFVKFMYTGKIESKYEWQIQAQMLISNRKWVDFVVHNIDFPQPIIITRVERDEAKAEKLMEGFESAVKQLQEILAKV